MAITIHFAGMILKYPSGSGPRTCQGCGGSAYAHYGEDRDGGFFYLETCFEGWNPKEPEKSIPCTKVLVK